jgi:hypothetical protein
MLRKPSRPERERELQALIGSDRGRVVALCKLAKGMQPGEVLTPGILSPEMIEAILEKEYGQGT